MDTDIKAFLDYLSSEKKYSDNTLAAYHSDISQLLSYAKSKSSDVVQGGVTLNSEVLSGYMQNLQERRYAVSTIARKIAAAKSFIKFMTTTGKVHKDLAPTLASPHVNKTQPKPLSVSEVRILLAEPAKSSAVEAKRDQMMLELLYATGMRVSELMALNVSDIDMKASKVQCSNGPTKVRVIPIDGHILKMCRDYVNNARSELVNDEKEDALILNRRGERLTRQGFWQIVKGYAEKVELGDKVTPRSLRHSFAIHRLNGGLDLQSVKELLGHAHISTTRAYKNV
jgi:integrase/recombinase XerD